MDTVSKRDAELVSQGWTRMFTVELSRVEEFVDVYRDAGFEVLVEIPVACAEPHPECGPCAPVLEAACRVIYVKKSGA